MEKTLGKPLFKPIFLSQCGDWGDVYIRGGLLRGHLMDLARTSFIPIIWDVDSWETIIFAVPYREHRAQATLFLLSKSSIF